MFNPWGLLIVALGLVLLWEAWLGDPQHLFGAITGSPQATQGGTSGGGQFTVPGLGPQIGPPPPGAGQISGSQIA